MNCPYSILEAAPIKNVTQKIKNYNVEMADL
jgi:hypothetical protein